MRVDGTYQIPVSMYQQSTCIYYLMFFQVAVCVRVVVEAEDVDARNSIPCAVTIVPVVLVIISHEQNSLSIN